VSVNVQPVKRESEDMLAIVPSAAKVSALALWLKGQILKAFASRRIWVRRYVGYCSFCREGYRKAGPLAEGPDHVYICAKCAEQCRILIEQAKQTRAAGK
jgi:hypothetical protein